MKRADLPVLLCKEDTYTVSAKVQQMVFRILPEDTDKIEQVQRLVKTYVKADEFLDSLMAD